MRKNEKREILGYLSKLQSCVYYEYLEIDKKMKNPDSVKPSLMQLFNCRNKDISSLNAVDSICCVLFSADEIEKAKADGRASGLKRFNQNYGADQEAD